MNELIRDLGVNALSEVIVRALFTLLSLTRSSAPPLLQRQFAGDTLAAILSKGLAQAARSSDQTDRIRQFLVSPEVESVVRHLLGFTLAENSGATRTSQEGSRWVQSIRNPSQELMPALRDEFCLYFSLYTHSDPASSSEQADALFDSIVAACFRAVTLAIDAGSLAAHEAASSFRHRQVLDELAKLRAVLLGAEHPPLDLETVRLFETRLRAITVSRFGHLTPPHASAAIRVPLEQIYVSPHFESHSDARRRIGLEAFAASLHRTVVVGDPGAGKSTLAAALAYRAAKAPEQRIIAGRAITPCLVALREYGATTSLKPKAVVAFIREAVASNYQLDANPETLEYLLTAGRIAVLFDGLDELVDTGRRVEVRDAIEAFCLVYPSTPVLVTSRKVGYYEAPLGTRTASTDQSARTFDVLTLATFEQAQVDSYVKRWFAADQTLATNERELRADAFLSESTELAELRSNPLMLALMCSLYRDINYIPRNKPDVLERCTWLLFEGLDKAKRIYPSSRFEPYVRLAIMEIATHLFRRGADDAIDEVELRRLVADHLHQVRGLPLDEAESQARELLVFCRDRAWVFTDVGTTSGGLMLFKFTHRTFLEYFAAWHLVRRYPTPGALLPQVLPRIARAEWDMVIQLAIHLQSRNVEGASDAVLADLLRSADIDSSATENIVLFATRLLEFLPAHRQLVAVLAERAMNSVIDSCVSDSGVVSPETYGMSPLVGSLFHVAPEHDAAVLAGASLAMVNLIRGGHDTGILFCAEFAALAGEISKAHVSAARGRSAWWALLTPTLLAAERGRFLDFAGRWRLAFEPRAETLDPLVAARGAMHARLTRGHDGEI